MEREIKFRAKTTANGHWVYGCLIDYGNNAISISNKRSNPWVQPETVGQFTGLSDCNGKEIYEGDIISLSDWAKPCEVIWNNEVASFKIRYIIEDGFCIPKDALGYWVQDHKDSVCVIGNKFDNPELLK